MNENFIRLIELLDNQSKTINSLENKLNSLVSTYFNEHPQFITLNYSNGDRGNCASNNYNFITDINVCRELFSTSNPNMSDSPNNSWPRGCYTDSNGNSRFNSNTVTTREIDNEYTQQICINPNPNL